MRIASKLVPLPIKRVVAGLEKAGFEAYPVGGAIRDLILRREIRDWDIATNATPSHVEKIFPKTIPTGKKFGTITVFQNKIPIQVTSYRTEQGYADRRRPLKVEFIGDLLSDLARRDFTMNAMALDLKKEELLDPFFGLRDLRKKRLRTVGNPTKRLAEDTLRVVRAGRFIAELAFKPDSELTKAARRIATHVKKLSAERIRDELTKIVLSPKPSRGLEWLERTGVLRHLLPDLIKGKGVRQGGWHRYDVYRHTLVALDAAPPDLTVRLALLLHDIAKPMTRTREGGRYHFYGHERIGAKMARTLLHKLRYPNTLIEDVSVLIRHHLFEDRTIARSDTAVRRLIQRVGEGRIDQLLALRRADVRGCGPGRRIPPSLKEIEKRMARIEREKQALKISDLAVDGYDVMRWLNVRPGPKVGFILAELLREVTERPGQNARNKLKARVLAYLPK